MTEEEVRGHCLSKEGVTESVHDKGGIVRFSARERMFCEIQSHTMPLKLNIRFAQGMTYILRAQYPLDVIPLPHTSRRRQRYICTVTCGSAIPDTEIVKMLAHAYREVTEKPKVPR